MATPSVFALRPANRAERPPPQPPRYLKRHIYTDPSVFEHIDLHAINEARTNYRNFRDLMWNLVFKQNYNDLEKARSIFRWLTTKNLYTVMFDSSMPGTPEQVVMAFKDGKASYAKIFECLAIHAGLHCITLSGWAKGVNCKPGSPITSTQPNHSWNAINVDGCWHLVDCHWATRYVQSDRVRTDSLVYEYDDFYFLTEPSMLIYSHYPEETPWQLVIPARSKTEYEEYPLVKSYFFMCGMQFLQQNRGILFTKRGIVTVTLGFTQPTAFTFKLAYGENAIENIRNMPLKRYVIQETTDNRVTFYLRIPAEGTYYLTLFAQRFSNTARAESLYRAACEYKVICDRAASETRPFPQCADLNWGAGAPVDQYGLIPSHKVALLAAPNGRAEVSFTKMRRVRLHAKLIHDGLPEAELEKAVTVGEQDNQLYVALLLPVVGEYGLEIYACDPARDGDTYSHICQYLCAFTDRDFGVLYGQVYDRFDLAPGMQADRQLYIAPGSQYTNASRQNGGLRNPPKQDGQNFYNSNFHKTTGSLRRQPGQDEHAYKPSGGVRKPPGPDLKVSKSTGSLRRPQEQDDLLYSKNRNGTNPTPLDRQHSSTKDDLRGPLREMPRPRPRTGDGLDELRRQRTIDRTPSSHSPQNAKEFVFETNIPVAPKKPETPKKDPLEIVYVNNVTEKCPVPAKRKDVQENNGSPVEIVFVPVKSLRGKDKFPSLTSPTSPGQGTSGSEPSSPNNITSPHNPRTRPQQESVKHEKEFQLPAPESFQPVPIQEIKLPPEPAPPENPPTPFKDRSIFRDVDSHAVEVSKEEYRSFRDLVWHLIYAREITNELDKARAIFLWLCSKDLTGLAFDSVQKGSPEEILMNLQRSQTTYAVVYEILCSYAGLHCKTISGYAKGAEYKPGMRFIGEQGQHSWNAVLVNGSWRLVDCHWAARRLVGKKITPENVRYELDEYYFMPDPHQLIFSHFPENPDWQLLEYPIRLEEFENLVPVKSSFFKYGLQVIDYREAVVRVDDEVTVRIACPPEKAETLSFTFTIAFDDGSEEFNGVKLNNFGMHETMDGVSYFTIRLPCKAAYRFIIYAKDSNQEHVTKDGVYSAVCEYALICLADPVHSQPFPPCVHTSWGPGDCAGRYSLKPLQKGAIFTTVKGVAEIRFQLPKEMRFTTKLRTSGREPRMLDSCVMQRVVSNIATFTVSPPGAGEYGLEIYANDPDVDGESLYHVYQYLIICNELITSTAKPLPPLPPGYLGAQPSFRKFGLSCVSHDDPYIVTDTGELQVNFLTSIPIRMTSQLVLTSENHEKECHEYVLQQCRGTSSVAFHIRLPRTGLYKFQVYALPLSDPNDTLPVVYNCLIDCTHVGIVVCPFPKQFGQWKDGCYLHEPINAHIQQNPSVDGRMSSHRNVYFKVDVPRANAVAVVVGDEWTQLETRGSPASLWEGEVNMEEFWGRESKVFICANYGSVSSSYHTLLEYTM